MLTYFTSLRWRGFTDYYQVEDVFPGQRKAPLHYLPSSHHYRWAILVVPLQSVDFGQADKAQYGLCRKLAMRGVDFHAKTSHWHRFTPEKSFVDLPTRISHTTSSETPQAGNALGSNTSEFS